MNKLQNKVLREEVEGENDGCYLKEHVKGSTEGKQPSSLSIRGSAKISWCATLALYTENLSGSINALFAFIARRLLSKRSTARLLIDVWAT